MLSTSFKFSKKDTPCNCADTKQNCVFLAFPSDLSRASLLLRSKNYNYMSIILIFIYIYMYLYLISSKGRREIYLWSCCLRAGACFAYFSTIKWFNMLSKTNQARIIKKYKVNIFKRQSICIYFLFGPINMDFEDCNFGLSIARVTL